jgi:tetratricopeptide (TPR) repeat protein
LRGDLDAIVATALRHEPEQRYASVDALADDVERYLEGRPVSARGPDRVYRARLFVRRHRVALAVSALAVVGLLTAVFVALLQARQARSEAHRAGAFHRFVALELKREQIEGVAMGPDGPTLGYVFDHGLLETDRILAGEPEAAAEVYSIAGETYYMVGAKQRAVRTLREALDRQRALYGERDPRLYGTRISLAHALLDSGATAEAGSLLAEQERDTRGHVDKERIALLGVLGQQRQWAGDLAAAEALNREWVTIQQRLGMEATADGINSRIRLATILYLEGKYRKCDRLLEEGVTLGGELAKSQAQLAGRRTALRAVPIIWMWRGYARQRSGDLDGAASAYQHALDGLAALKPKSWAAGHASCGLGLLLVEKGDGGAGRAMLAREDVAAADPSHPLARGFGDPGVSCPALNAWARDDLDGFDRALAARPAALRPATRADRDLLRAELLLTRDRAVEALALCDEAVRDRDGTSELQPWRRAEAHVLRGEVLYRLGRQAEGRQEMVRYAAVLRERVPRHRFLGLAEPAVER